MIQVLIISSLYSQTQHLRRILLGQAGHCLLYTSDAADE